MAYQIALCTGISEYGNPEWNGFETCKKYPGSQWIPYFEKFAQAEGFSVIDGRRAMKDQDHSKTLIVQESLDSIGQYLQATGGKPAVLFCLESPLYDPYFYDLVHRMKSIFPSQILFRGLGNEIAYFPSFDEEKRMSPPPWKNRKRLCMIASNKYYTSFTGRYLDSLSHLEAIKKQLHTRRIEALVKMRPDLYGKGWAEAKEIPPGEKLDVMSQYQYAVCFENIAMPGYVTEKIIDCFVAGTIPLYLGATDIEGFVPTETFVYATGDFEGFREHPEWFDEFAPTRLISAQNFLDSPEGKRFSYQSFARKVLECVKKVS